jgi:hypothetical protein
VPIISALLLVPSVGGLSARRKSSVRRWGGRAHARYNACHDIGVLLTGLIGVIIYVIQSIREARK